MITSADTFDTSDTPIGGNPFDIAEFNPAMSGSDTVLMRQRPENTFGDLLDADMAEKYLLTKMSAGVTTREMFERMMQGFDRAALQRAVDKDRGAVIEAVKRGDEGKLRRLLRGEHQTNGGHKIVDGKIVE